MVEDGKGGLVLPPERFPGIYREAAWRKAAARRRVRRVRLGVANARTRARGRRRGGRDRPASPVQSR